MLQNFVCSCWSGCHACTTCHVRNSDHEFQQGEEARINPGCRQPDGWVLHCFAPDAPLKKTFASHCYIRTLVGDEEVVNDEGSWAAIYMLLRPPSCELVRINSLTVFYIKQNCFRNSFFNLCAFFLFITVFTLCLRSRKPSLL